jgi:hypothetical protein
VLNGQGRLSLIPKAFHPLADYTEDLALGARQVGAKSVPLSSFRTRRDIRADHHASVLGGQSCPELVRTGWEPPGAGLLIEDEQVVSSDLDRRPPRFAGFESYRVEAL